MSPSLPSNKDVLPSTHAPCKAIWVRKVSKGQKIARFPDLPYLLSRVDICPTTLLSVDNLYQERSHGFVYDFYSRQ